MDHEIFCQATAHKPGKAYLAPGFRGATLASDNAQKWNCSASSMRIFKDFFVLVCFLHRKIHQ